MPRDTIVIAFFGLMVVGCASDGKMEASDTSPSTVSGEAAMSSPTMSAAAPTESNSMTTPRSSTSRSVPGLEEDTLAACLAGIPQDATVGQKMLAEQTCRREYASRGF